MGLLDGLGSIIGDALSGKSVNLAAVANQLFQNAGGLQGITDQLNRAGLGEQVASWIGTGNNLPVSAEQIKAALSSEQLRSLAQSFGVDIDQLPQILAEHLPKAIDKDSPDGVLPS
ncbi:YidB family protein [Agrobacterium sp. BA1120]|uniref:YidB family protein n=1 Tax=Agrobacterium sp. BA1120 TaxID=3228927 RepID=UPI00336AC5F2